MRRPFEEQKSEVFSPSVVFFVRLGPCSVESRIFKSDNEPLSFHFISLQAFSPAVLGNQFLPSGRLFLACEGDSSMLCEL